MLQVQDAIGITPVKVEKWDTVVKHDVHDVQVRESG